MADDAHDRDFYAWTITQAAALRARKSGDNILDYDNLAEEVEDLGRSQRRACESQIDNILTHLLKIQFVGGEPVAHWTAEVVAFRVELERDLSPTLRAQLPDELQSIYASSAKKLKARLAADGLTTEIPDACPFTWDNVLGDGAEWMPTPAAGG